MLCGGTRGEQRKQSRDPGSTVVLSSSIRRAEASSVYEICPFSPYSVFCFFFSGLCTCSREESKEIQAGQVVLKAMTQVSWSFLYPWNNINICVLYPETSLSGWAPFSNLLPVPPLQRISNDASPPFVALSSPSVHIRAQCSYQGTNGAEIYSPERNLRAALIRTMVE